MAEGIEYMQAKTRFFKIKYYHTGGASDKILYLEAEFKFSLQFGFEGSRFCLEGSQFGLDWVLKGFDSISKGPDLVQKVKFSLKQDGMGTYLTFLRS